MEWQSEDYYRITSMCEVQKVIVISLILNQKQVKEMKELADKELLG